MNQREILHAGELLLAEELTSQARHQLNNHIAAVRNSSFYIRKKVERTTTLTADDPRIGTFFDLIDRELVSAGDLVSTQERARSVNVGSVQASSLGALLWPLVSSGSCLLRIATDQPLSVTDPIGLAVVIRCLMKNAVEALGTTGGSVSLSSQRMPHGSVIEVRNDAPGFAAGSLGRALEPFFSTREGHLGIGLNVAHRVVGSLGGRIVLEQEESGCAVARVSLPEVRS